MRPVKRKAKHVPASMGARAAVVTSGAGGASSVSLAEAALETLQPAAAAEHFRAALTERPDDPDVLDALGEVLIQLDDPVGARAAFERSAVVAPSAGFAKWMYLGQLSRGNDAVEHFTRGLGVINARLDAGATGQDAAKLRRRLSEAFCSLAELFLTDLCDEADAEPRCAMHAASALEADAGNPEAHLVNANLRLCQKAPAEAAVFMRRACELMRALEDDESEDEGGEVSGGGAGAGGGASAKAARPALPAHVLALGMPSMDVRLDAARTCMEMELYDEASHLFDRLLGEDDTNMEVWFLAGEAALLGGDAELAVDLLTTADAMVSAALAASGSKRVGRSVVLAASAAASAASSVQFSSEAIEALIATPISSLAEQSSMIRALLAKAQETLTAAGSGAQAAAGEGREDDDMAL